jgi:hypothetical protein
VRGVQHHEHDRDRADQGDRGRVLPTPQRGEQEDQNHREPGSHDGQRGHPAEPGDPQDDECPYQPLVGAPGLASERSAGTGSATAARHSLGRRD